MKILIFSDIHLHNWQYGATITNGMNSRLGYQEDVLNQIAMVAVKGIDMLVFCGDLFHVHGRIDASVLKVASDFFNVITDLNIPVFVLVGNHDLALKDRSIHSLSWIKDAHIINHATRKKYNDHEFAFMPYTESQEELERFLMGTSSESIVFLHQGVSGVPMGSGFVIPNEILTPQMVDRFRRVFTGHYHNHRRVSRNLTVIGATMQHTWADVGERRGWLIYDTEENKVRLYESDHPKFIEVKYKENISDIPIKDNFVKVHGAPSDDCRDLYCDAISVELVKEEKETVDLGKFKNKNFRINETLQKYAEQNKLTERQIEVGKQIREGRYETPLSDRDS